jgi:type IV pilus assembly protein PilV
MSPSAQAGAGLIEVAVALLVLSVGALGLGSLQITAKRMGYEAVQRTDAAALAMDLFERMRANRAALAAYATEAIGEASGASLPVPAMNCNLANCSSAQLRRWDLWQWERALNGVAATGSSGGLLRPTACVAVSGRLVTVQIAWQGARALSEPALEDRCGAGNYGPDDTRQQLLLMTSWIGEDQL